MVDPSFALNSLIVSARAPGIYGNLRFAGKDRWIDGDASDHGVLPQRLVAHIGELETRYTTYSSPRFPLRWGEPAH